MSPKKDEERIFFGLFLIVIGTLFLLEKLGYLNFRQIVATYWPAMLILLGVSIYIGRGFRSSSEAAFLILTGAFFLLLKLHIFQKHFWQYLWPALLIVIGIWIILRR